MKLYIADKEKLTTYDLPEKISESFLFSYTPVTTNIEVFISIYSKDGSWYIKDTDDFTINNKDEDIKLDSYETYMIKFKGSVDSVYLYTYEGYNNNYQDILIENIDNITIGSSPQNSVIYSNNLTAPTHITIKSEENAKYLNVTEFETKIYVNKRIVENKKLLYTGDTIFLNNLKMIWMGSFIRVFFPKDNVSFNNNILIKDKETIDNSQYLNYNMKENDEDLYSDDDFFFHKPRLTIGYDEEETVIDAPTNKESREELPLIFTLGASMTMVITSFATLYRSISNYNQGRGSKSELIISIVTASAMIICSFLIPKLSMMYNRKRKKKRDELREKKYTEYLEKKQAEINKIIKYESQTLYDNNPSAQECFENLIGKKNRLWEKEITDNDFLTIRVGTGNVPSSVKVTAPEEKFTLDPDELIQRAHSIAKNAETLINVPSTVSLCENFVSSIVCSYPNSESFINGIILQLITLHNPKDLKIIFLTSKKNAYKWEYMKLIPHIYSDDKSVRYFADDEDETKKVLKEIDELYNSRKEEIKNSSQEINEEIEKTDYYKSFSPYYLIITDNYRKYKNLDFINKITTFNKNIGFSLLILDSTLKNLPNQCNKYTYVTDKLSCIFEKDYTKSKQLNFTTEVFDNLDMYRAARELSNVPVQTLSELYNLPTMISFLEMYGVGNIEQLNISNKWSSSNPMTTLQCPIGVSPSGELFKLDLHEKAHGPHGLIAGSTGSGKSEFIITYILSMAINYHPDEVQFVLIDYKGGGLAGAFENKETGVRIPHLAGTITNLDISEMNRTLVSINSEMKRRQKKFNEVKDKLGESTIDIYKYQKYYREGLIDEPIPHLFIISDEFAELKSQQPEFMDELISTARIGRSLGVHLILATQKPAGVVNDQIWSNSKFKVCLKVQTKQDSMEMLKRPEAASIKETGRFYLQVGYDELFEQGQSAWAGAPYIPTEKVIKKVDDSVNFIDNTGTIVKSINNIIQNKDAKQSKNGDQLTNIVKYLNDIATRENIKRKQLWLDSIPGEIYLSNIMTKYNFQPKPFEIEGVIGEYDDPTTQHQGLLSINFTKNGNTLIYGIPGSGKENLLTTLITSICTKHQTEEVNIYIMDFGAETLSKFKNYPQVGDIVYIDEIEKANSLYTFLNKEINKRKALFNNYSGTYSNYIKQSGKTVPNIICIIHQYENMLENLSSLAEKFINLFKEGPKFGITFILTNSLITGIRIKVLQLFPNKLTLKLNDKDDYRFVIDSPRNLVPAKYLGRGLVKLDNNVYEYQTAYVSKPDDISKTIMDLATTLKSAKLKKAPAIPTLPKFFTVDKLINTNYTLDKVPVGISKAKLTTETYNFNENYSPVITNNISDNIHFIYGLIELLKQIPNTKVRVIDVLDLYKNSQGVNIFNKDFETIIKQVRLETLDDDNLDHTNIFIIIGLGAFKNNVPEKTQNTFKYVFNKIKEYKRNKFIIYDDYNSYKSLEVEEWFKNIDKSTGIWLGGDAANQLSIKLPNLTLEDRKQLFNQIGYIVKNSSHTIVRYIVDKEFDNEK